MSRVRLKEDHELTPETKNLVKSMDEKALIPQICGVSPTVRNYLIAISSSTGQREKVDRWKRD